MYKKIISLSLFLSFLPLVAFSAEDPSRIRLYVPASVSASVEGCDTCTVGGSGYAAHYVFGFGLGLGVSNSKLTITPPVGDAIWADTGMMTDISYTFGSEFTFTLGYGMGSSNTNSQAESNSEYWTAGGATNSLIGFGYDFGGFEALLAMRIVTSKMTYYTLPVESSWNSTEIGVGFTF